MSNVIKSSCVLFDSTPIVIKGFNKPAVTTSEKENNEINVGKMLSQNALESAEISISAAVKEVENIKQRGKVETHFAYLNGFNDGKKRGSLEGIDSGRKEGTSVAQNNHLKQADDLLNFIKSIDAKTLEEKKFQKDDCVDFAFGLAESILGIEIDREKEEYKELENSFFEKEKDSVAIETGGQTYMIETLQTDAILKSCDGLQGISAYKKEKPKAVEKKEEVKPLEVLKEKTEETEIPKESPANVEIVTPKESENSASLKNDEKQNTESFVFRSFDKEKKQDLEKENSEFFEDSLQENLAEQTQNDEKFVFLNPISRKSKRFSKGANLSIEDLLQFSKDDLKAVFKKFQPKDIAAAIQNESEDVKSAITEVLTRKTRDKVVEALKYLSPIKEEESEKAKELILSSAKNI